MGPTLPLQQKSRLPRKIKQKYDKNQSFLEKKLKAGATKIKIVKKN